MVSPRSPVRAAHGERTRPSAARPPPAARPPAKRAGSRRPWAMAAVPAGRSSLPVSQACCSSPPPAPRTPGTHGRAAAGPRADPAAARRSARRVPRARGASAGADGPAARETSGQSRRARPLRRSARAAGGKPRRSASLRRASLRPCCRRPWRPSLEAPGAPPRQPVFPRQQDFDPAAAAAAAAGGGPRRGSSRWRRSPAFPSRAWPGGARPRRRSGVSPPWASRPPRRGCGSSRSTAPTATCCRGCAPSPRPTARPRSCSKAPIPCRGGRCCGSGCRCRIGPRTSTSPT
jgi:hypothetical protein